MHVSNRIASGSTSDTPGNLAAKAAGKAVEEDGESGSSAQLSGGSYDPSALVFLSVDALLVLSASQNETGRPGTARHGDFDAAALATLEYESFGHFLDEGNRTAYYRAYLDYHDGMQPAELPAERRVETPFDEAAVRQTTATERRATPIAAILHPAGPDAETHSRPAGGISRATTMYALGF